MTYYIESDKILDLSNEEMVRKETAKMSEDFLSKDREPEAINIQEYKPVLKTGEFLAPLFINWRKPVDAADIQQSSTITDKRKKIIRQAVSQSERQGIKYELINPLDPASFAEFLDYYQKNHQDLHYESLLEPDYLAKRDPALVYLIKVTDTSGNYLGGRLISKFNFKLSTDQRALERTKLIKEGYDTVCEKIFFELGARLGVKYLARGREFNLRGVNGRRIGLLWNKLKYGYSTYILPQTPRVYADFSFLKEQQFDLAFFVSLENQPEIKQTSQRLVWNFVLGDNPDWQEIELIKEKLVYPVHIYSRDFQLVREFLI